MTSNTYEKRERIILQLLIKGKVNRRDLKSDFYNIRSIPRFVSKNSNYFVMENGMVSLNKEEAPKWLQYILYIQDQYRNGKDYVTEVEITKVFDSNPEESLIKKKMFVIKRKVGNRIAWELVEVLKQASLPNQKLFQTQNELECPQETA